MFSLSTLFILIGVQCVCGSPEPLVSSNGIKNVGQTSTLDIDINPIPEISATYESGSFSDSIEPAVTESQHSHSKNGHVLQPNFTDASYAAVTIPPLIVTPTKTQTNIERGHSLTKINNEDFESSSRIARESAGSDPTTYENLQIEKETKTSTAPSPEDVNDVEESIGFVETNDKQSKIKLGPPWTDDEIVGKLFKDPLIDPTEVSFKVASKLCQKIARQGNPSEDLKRRYYLWAPINQYVPLLRKAFPIRPPLFAPECLKWVLQQCRGTVRLPMLQPCTYWAPMPIRRPECGFNPKLQSRLVNYRLPEFVPGNCPCVWPCTKRFDPIQRCRITPDESELLIDAIHADGDPWNEKEIVIQDNLAAQLCRGMKPAMTESDYPVSIGWIPIRIDLVANNDKDNYDAGESEGSPFNIASTMRRKREENYSKMREKRERIYLNPGQGTSASSESEEEYDNDKGDRFSLMGTYNLDRQEYQNGNGTNVPSLAQCTTWEYKPCPRGNEDMETRRKKRSIPSYMSSMVTGLNGDYLQNAQRFVRQSTVLDEDDMIFETTANCGKWVKTKSYKCIPEEHVKVALKISSSEEESHVGDKLKLAIANQKKKVVKDLCPGSVGKFPCFLRKKRSLTDDVMIQNMESYPESTVENIIDSRHLNNNDDIQKTETKRDTRNDQGLDDNKPEPRSSVYVIDKIQIRPDASCMCDWPCLPFFDRVNRCYNTKGELLKDAFGRPRKAGRSFRKTQRDPVVCINFVEVDDIYCRVKD